MTLERLKPQLAALRSDELRSPALPMATALQEAADLAKLCSIPRVHAALVAIGQKPGFIEDLEQRVQAARQAQSTWVTVRDQTKSSDLVALETRAGTLRSQMIAAGRWNLRAHREAQATLTAIRGGDSIANLVQDLFDLAALYDQHAGAFASDKSFDAAAHTAEAREVAQRLSEGASAARLDPSPSDQRDLRDRAFTYLHDRVSELRAAGRYAFRQEPDMLKRFASHYRRRQRQAAKGAATTRQAGTPDPECPSVPVAPPT